MKTFIFNLVLTFVLVYFAFQGYEKLPYNAFVVLVMSCGILLFLWLISFFYDKNHFTKLPKAVSLILFFFKELLVASIKVAHDVLTPTHYMKPGVIALPLEAKTDFEITLLANMISLTPGTLSIDVSEDRKILFVHAVYIENNDTESLKKELKNGFERRLLQLTR